MPDFELEATHGADRGKLVIGVDEAGRGPWAGPVNAAAVWLAPQRLPADLRAGLDDSKKLTRASREAMFREMRALASAEDPPLQRRRDRPSQHPAGEPAGHGTGRQGAGSYAG